MKSSMAKEETNKPEEKEIIIKLSMDQTAKVGLMFDEVLRGTGMKYNGIITDLSRQIAEQMPKTGPVKLPMKIEGVDK